MVQLKAVKFFAFARQNDKTIECGIGDLEFAAFFCIQGAVFCMALLMILISVKLSQSESVLTTVRPVYLSVLSDAWQMLNSSPT